MKVFMTIQKTGDGSGASLPAPGAPADAYARIMIRDDAGAMWVGTVMLDVRPTTTPIPMVKVR